MNDQDRLRFERRGRELVLLWGAPAAIAAMLTRTGEPVPDMSMAADERQVRALLMYSEGLNRTTIARRLGLSYNTLWRWLPPDDYPHHVLGEATAEQQRRAA